VSRPFLAVIIPAFNEEVRILPTLTRIGEYLASQDYTWHVVVVSDGSTDQTHELVANFAAKNPGFSLNVSPINRGKGYVVRKGMLETDAEYLLFSDADLATPIEEIEKLMPKMEQYDIAIGSRPLRESNLTVRQPKYREMLGRAANKLIQIMGLRGIQDTQCGFKLFKFDVARDVFRRCKLNGFSFDFESLMIARDLNYTIAEIPITWHHMEGSKVVLWRDVPRNLRDLLKLRLWGKKRRLEVPIEP
jgi:dolichyl-phosphate beta-glucosyltransferase